MPSYNRSAVSTCSSTCTEWNADRFSRCYVCCMPLQSLVRKNTGAENSTEHSHVRVCSTVCLQIFSFVQGFVLGKALCTLLDLHGSSIKSPLKLEVKFPVTYHGQEKLLGGDDEFVTDLPVMFSRGGVDSEPGMTVIPEDPSRHQAASSDGGDLTDSEPAVSWTKTGNMPKRFPEPLHKSKRRKVMKGHRKANDNMKAKTAASIDRKQRSTITLSAKSRGRNEKSKVVCFECGKEFSHKSSLDGHTRLKHKKDARPCRVCGKEFYGPAGLSIHMHKVHKDEKPVDCDLCDEKFSSSADRDRHLSLDHGKKHGMCHICGKYFKYSWTLRSHILAHSGIRRFVCEHCGKGFLRSNTLRDHKKLVHFCQGCMKLFSSCSCPDGPKKKVWTRHPKKSTVKNYSRLRCYMCYKTLENIHAYESHMNAHKSERPYGCDECGKRFMHKAGLQTHMHQHKAKRFECDVCKKTFTYKCNMEIHKQVHNEGKPYACEFCSKTFKTKATLENHRNRHIEERQYKCHICGKGLAKLHNLKRHLKVMHPNTESESSSV